MQFNNGCNLLIEPRVLVIVLRCSLTMAAISSLNHGFLLSSSFSSPLWSRSRSWPGGCSLDECSRFISRRELEFIEKDIPFMLPFTELIPFTTFREVIDWFTSRRRF